MPKCTFCGNNLEQLKGKLFIDKAGDSSYFCNSKCQKNFRLGRLGKRVKWTKKFIKGVKTAKE
ncbi:MAG: 50S ribosomal protein L24e [Candidatus Aenigmarchaeota archaeon]|nr:50S ribosomal protein L24e [Candidatus Aenigmarchaeota archaeon]